MDFVAIDFETANSRPDSACQLALVVVRQGEIVDEHCWLVRPPRLYFSSRNIAIHGIRPEHVERADSLGQLWQALHPLLEDQVILAHNARFDIGVLVASLASHDIACPALDFSCTRAIARRAWPNQPRYGLKPLGTWLGIEFRHHDALEDARTCAKIALAAASQIQATDLPSLEKELRLTRGRYSLGRIAGPRGIGGSRSRIPMRTQSTAEGRSTYVSGSLQRRGTINAQVVVDSAAGARPLEGKRILFLGNLRGLTQEDTRQLAERLGAVCESSLSPLTDYVVACGGTLLVDAARVISDGKQAETEPSPSATETPIPKREQSIRLLSERQFLALVPGGKASVSW